MKASLNLLVIRAADPDGLAEFYGALGLTFEKHRHGQGPEHFSCELEGGCVFEIYPLTKNGNSTAATRLGFQVESVADAVASLEAKGAKVLTPPQSSEWGLRAVIQDPAGHKVELTEI